MLPFTLDQGMLKLDYICNEMGVNLDIDIENAALYLYNLESFFVGEFNA